MQPVVPAPRSGWTSLPPSGWDGDAALLARELAASLEGEVGFDTASRALFAVDASNYRQVPIGVVWPRSLADVERTVALCRQHGAPLLSRGGGTSLAGQCCNVAVVIDWTRYLGRVLDVDPDRRLARVEPGTVLDTLRDAAEEHGLTFGPDPATHDHCTLGGMLGNNSCGVHSVMSGRTADNVRQLEVLTYDGLRLRVGATSEEELSAIVAGGGRRGEIYRAMRELRDRHAPAIRERFPDIPRRVSGYNLDELLPERGFHVARALVGSEGTLATILEATLELVPSPPCRALLAVEYEDISAAADHAPMLLELGPLGLEGLDGRLLDDQKKKGMNPQSLDLLPDLAGGWLLVEFGGESQEEADTKARRAKAAIEGSPSVENVRLFSDRADQDHIWRIRESGLGATARVPGESDTWPGWEDSAVPPERMGDYLRALRSLMRRYGYEGAFYGHFGQGCLHTRITFDLVTARGLERWHRFLVESAELCVAHGGSLSGEHGDGQQRAELLPIMFGDELTRAFREFKAIWDPAGRMNPGKVVDPYPVLSNLRLGAEYRPWEPATQFAFREDERQFSRAVLRCVGVGTCRRLDGGSMCPSYMVTREEKHSTRGRAHLLWEMLQGEVITDGWASEEVKEALDLCLACKGCKSDCPVNVDMATYKAEFLYHYYRRRRRPTAAYSMGLIHWWARLASHLPRLVNTVMATPGISALLKTAGGISRRRDLPRFATRTFRRRFAGHRTANPHGPEVILYPDTFTDFFHPEIGEAAVEVLEGVGFRVRIPSRRLCCGRPLYDYGFLPLARKLLRRNLEALRDPIRRGVPIVGLEPSCIATFRDELVDLLPSDLDARRLQKQFFTLAELLEERAGDVDLPRLDRPAKVHGHCHHKAVMGLDAESRLLARLGIDAEVLDTGCCGMAGSFGFQADTYELSMACGERKLLPIVRRSAPRDLLVADGFSCRTQIEQASDRRALHVAQVVQMALREGRSGPPSRFPESDYVERQPTLPRVAGVGLAVVAGAVAAAGAALGGGAWRRRASGESHE